ncbi:MAG: GNAT family N-acetyltransferase [Bryobacteraceae bacterium]
MKFSLRESVAEDEPFIERLLKVTLAEELMAHAWPEPMRDNLLSMQYRGRRQSVVSVYPNTAVQIISMDGEDAGWLVVARTDEAICLADIALLPERRGAGVGTAILETLIQESRDSRKPVRLHVMINNPAARLYERMGFRPVHDDQVNREMERLP